MTAYSYTDPAGRTLTIETDDTSAQLRLWQSQFTVNSPLNGRIPDSLKTRLLTVSRAGNHDEWLSADTQALKVAEYSLSGGTLEVWKPSDDQRQGLARWLGPYSEVATFLPFQLWENQSFVLGYFDELAFQDAPTGVSVGSLTSSATVSVLDVSAVIAGIGLLEVRSPAAALGDVPSWAGLELPAGELWQVTDDVDLNVTDHLILASDTAIASITPGFGATLVDCLDFAIHLTQLSYQEV